MNTARMRAIRITTRAVVVAALPLLAACSHATDPTSAQPSATATPTTLSRATFIQQADAICASNRALPSPPGDPAAATTTDLKAWSTFFQTTIPVQQDIVRRIRTLTPPPNDRATVNTVLAHEDATIKDAQALQQAAADGDLTKFESVLTTFTADGSAADTAANAYGATVCGGK